MGTSAARAFLGLGAQVTVLEKDVQKLQQLEENLGGRVTTMISNEYNIKRVVKFADVLLGAVMISGQRSPVLVTREMVASMRPGSVIIDFSIDQGGCVETSRPTTLDDPTYVAHEVVHYCVPNMTANVPRTASRALAKTTRSSPVSR